MGILLTFCAVAWSQKTPMFYGWFFNEIVADGLKNVTDNYLQSLYTNVEEVQGFLKNVSTKADITNPLQYFTKPADPNTGSYDKYFHITTFYCGTDDCSNYTRQVAQYINQTFGTHLVGVFFTPRTYGIRVNLTSIQREIFNLNELNTISHGTSRILYGTEEPCDTEIFNGIQFCPQNDTDYHPTDTRAHVTLGCAPNISAVTTGLDLIEILQLEMDPSRFCAKIQVEQGNLIQMGENCDTFVLYLEEKIVANSTFEVYYNNAATLAVPCSVQYVALLFFSIIAVLKL